MRINNVPLRRVLLPTAVLAVLLLAGWYFVQPLPFPGLDGCARVEVTCLRLSPGSIEREFTTLLPGSPEWEELGEVLSGSSCHRCLDTLLGSSSTGSTGRCVIHIFGYSQTGELEVNLTVTSAAHILRDGLAYRLGWWGAGAGQGLTEALTRALGFPSP